MVKHIIIWNLKDELSAEEKVTVMQGIKDGLEGLQGRIPGLVEIKVYTEKLGSSNTDLMLDSTFEDAAALKTYSDHPEHMDVAVNKVRPYVKMRSCFDYEI